MSRTIELQKMLPCEKERERIRHGGKDDKIIEMEMTKI